MAPAEHPDAEARPTTGSGSEQPSAVESAPRAAEATPRENLVVTSRLRETVHAHDLCMSWDLVEALNEHVHDVVDRAVARARDNARSTVRPGDL